MQNLHTQLKKEIIRLSSDVNFIHHKWFIEHHLEIVEKITLQLLEKYPDADRDIVFVMVWMHDYGKIINFDNQYTETIKSGVDFLVSIGYEKDFAKKIISYIDVLDKKEGLTKKEAPIEIKIVSSADAASHMIGPFYGIYWYENQQKEIGKIVQDNIRKLEKDWGKKVVLPEIREAYKVRYEELKSMFESEIIGI